MPPAPDRPRRRPVRPARGRRPTPRSERSRSRGGRSCKRHHPDIAGTAALEPREADQRRPRLAERPASSRAHYDRERPGPLAARPGRPLDRRAARTAVAGTASHASARRPPTRRPRCAGSSIASARLSRDELDRLSAWRTRRSIAFVAIDSPLPHRRPRRADPGRASTIACASGCDPSDWANGPAPRRDPRGGPRAGPRRVPRRAPDRAVPRSCARSPDARLGGRDRPAALRPEQRRGRAVPRPRRAPHARRARTMVRAVGARTHPRRPVAARASTPRRTTASVSRRPSQGWMPSIERLPPSGRSSARQRPAPGACSAARPTRSCCATGSRRRNSPPSSPHGRRRPAIPAPAARTTRRPARRSGGASRRAPWGPHRPAGILRPPWTLGSCSSKTTPRFAR